MQHAGEGQVAPKADNQERKSPPVQKFIREQNDKLVVHVGGIPPMMPEDVVKTTAQQFGPVKDFFKVTKHFEKAYEYAPSFGFLTFEDEASAARALHAGSMNISDIRLSLNPRRAKNGARGPGGQPRHSAEISGGNVPKGPSNLPDRPPHARNHGSLHVKKPSMGAHNDFKRPSSVQNRARNNSTCTIYGLPEAFASQDLADRGNVYGRVINSHIFEYKDREGRRFGTLGFDSSLIAEEFQRKENGQVWGGCAIRVTLEPFHIAKRNGSPPFRSGHNGSHNYQRFDQRPYDGGRRYQGGNRPQRYQQNGHGRFNQRNGFGQAGSYNQPSFQGQQQYPTEPHFYEQQMMGYPQYPQQYPPMMSPPQMITQTPYGPVGIPSSPPAYGGQMMMPMMQTPYRSPPLTQNQIAMHPQNVGGQYPYSGPEYLQRFDGSRNTTVDESPSSKGSILSEETAGMRKVSHETSLTVPTATSEALKHNGSEYRRPLVIKAEDYLRAGYEYGNRKPADLLSAQSNPIPQEADAVKETPIQAPTEVVPAVVPETKDPEDPSNIFIKNIDDDIISKPEHLEAHCKKFGEIVSISLPTYPNGLIKGFGFVKFTTPEQALKAKKAMDLQMLGRKRLFVSFAETGDHRQSRLQKFYQAGSKREISPDPLITQAASAAKREDEKSNPTTPVKDGDATSDVPVEKSPEAENKTDKPDIISEEEKNTEDVQKAVDGATMTDAPKASTDEVTSLPVGGEPNNISTNKAVESGQTGQEKKKEKHGRKLSAEQLKELDEKLRKILEGLKASDLMSRSNSNASSSGEAPTKKEQQSVENMKEKESAERSAPKKTLEPAATEAPKEDGNPLSEVPPRNQTRTSDSSSSSRLSEEEFSQALKDKFGDKIPRTVKATDIFEAVDTFVKSRNNSQRGSPLNESAEATAEKTAQQTNKDAEKEEAGNIVAPTPSRKVSVQNISPGEGKEDLLRADEPKICELKDETPNIEELQVEEPKVEEEVVAGIPQVTEMVGPNVLDREGEIKPVDEKVTDTVIASDEVDKLEIKQVDSPQNIPVLSSEAPKFYKNNEKAFAGYPKRNSAPTGHSKQQLYGTGSGFERAVRNQLQQGSMEGNYRHAQGMHASSSPSYAKFPRGVEQQQPFPPYQTQQEERFQQQLGTNQGNNFVPPPLQHAQGIICDGPCCQFNRYPSHPSEAHGAMVPGYMSGPFYDPGMYMFPPQHPGMFNGHPGMFPPPHWAGNLHPHPSVPPHQQPGYHHPGMPQGPQYSPPVGPNSERMVGMDHGNPNRGHQGYGHYPQMASYGGNQMFYEPGMQGGPQQFPGQEHYHGQHGGPGVPTF
ncbi:hypothetical protein ABW19_dt0203925 [Dactylella cylindrospora]|nr:hypothetical protein ABW19_dt0203925 [Dactylella cylindrospora]